MCPLTAGIDGLFTVGEESTHNFLLLRVCATDRSGIVSDLDSRESLASYSSDRQRDPQLAAALGESDER